MAHICVRGLWLRPAAAPSKAVSLEVTDVEGVEEIRNDFGLATRTAPVSAARDAVDEMRTVRRIAEVADISRTLVRRRRFETDARWDAS